MNSQVRISLLFVFLWSSGYIAFEFCSPYIEPATCILVRTAITATMFFYIVLFMRTGWPRRWKDYFHSSVVGVLLHGVFAGGLFASIYHGIDLRLSALILSLQPILTVLLSTIFLGEKITKRKMLGVPAGFLGVSILILESNADAANISTQVGINFRAEDNFLAISLCFVSLLAISSATIIQKRYCSEIKLMPGACIQFTAATIFILPFALIFETMRIELNIDFILGMGWLIIVLSLGAMSLLMILIKHGEAGSVANLLYLVTPLVAVEAWILFDEPITLISLGGMLLCIAGVAVVNYTPTAKPVTKLSYLNRIKELEAQNYRLRKLYDDVVLENTVMKNMIERNTDTA